MTVLRRLVFLLQMPFSVRQRRRMATRPGRHAFIAGFPGQEQIAEVVWNLLQGEAMFPGFTPAPDDALLHVWGLADEDLDDLVLEGLQRVGGRVPRPEEIGDSPVLVTVADLVSFLARFSETP
jgi:hypothetical protein